MLGRPVSVMHALDVVITLIGYSDGSFHFLDQSFAETITES